MECGSKILNMHNEKNNQKKTQIPVYTFFVCVLTKTFFFFLLLLVLNLNFFFKLENNCFTMLCCFLLNNIINQCYYLAITKLLSVWGTVLNPLHGSHLSIMVVFCEITTLSIMLMRKLRYRESERQLISERVKVRFKPKLSWISRSLLILFK